MPDKRRPEPFQTILPNKNMQTLLPPKMNQNRGSGNRGYAQYAALESAASFDHTPPARGGAYGSQREFSSQRSWQAYVGRASSFQSQGGHPAYQQQQYNPAQAYQQVGRAQSFHSQPFQPTYPSRGIDARSSAKTGQSSKGFFSSTGQAPQRNCTCCRLPLVVGYIVTLLVGALVGALVVVMHAKGFEFPSGKQYDFRALALHPREWVQPQNWLQAGAAETSTLQPQPAASTSTRGMVFDCSNAPADWQRVWGAAQKEYCCSRGQCPSPPQQPTVRATPPPPHTPAAPAFNCEADYGHWQKSWSPEKQKWCCSHAQLGCLPVKEHAASSPSTTKSPEEYNCVEGFNDWKSDWPPAKKTWCCSRYGRGCSKEESASPHYVAEEGKPLAESAVASAGASGGCQIICRYKSISATCLKRIVYTINHNFAGKPSACTKAFDLVMEQCEACSQCRPSTLASLGC